MNPQYEKQLEASVRCELDALGEMPAPPALANRILRAIEARAATPWYRQSWTAWPLALRTASLSILLLAFGGLCWAGWQLPQGATGLEVGGWFEAANTLWRTLVVLADTTVSLVNRLGSGVITVGAILMFVSWVACIGLGTAYVRLAMRPARN